MSSLKLIYRLNAGLKMKIPPVFYWARTFPKLRRNNLHHPGMLSFLSYACYVSKRVCKFFCSWVEYWRFRDVRQRVFGFVLHRSAQLEPRPPRRTPGRGPMRRQITGMTGPAQSRAATAAPDETGQTYRRQGLAGCSGSGAAEFRLGGRGRPAGARWASRTPSVPAGRARRPGSRGHCPIG